MMKKILRKKLSTVTAIFKLHRFKVKIFVLLLLLQKKDKNILRGCPAHVKELWTFPLTYGKLQNLIENVCKIIAERIISIQLVQFQEIVRKEA